MNEIEKSKGKKLISSLFGSPEAMVKATGTKNLDLAHRLVIQMAESLWLPKELSYEEKKERIQSAFALLLGIKPVGCHTRLRHGMPPAVNDSGTDPPSAGF